MHKRLFTLMPPIHQDSILLHIWKIAVSDCLISWKVRYKNFGMTTKV